MRTSPRRPRSGTPRSAASALAALATLLLAGVTAYLTLERNHAEEVGGGLRAALEILRGERPVAPLTWAVWAAVAAAFAVRALSGLVRGGRPGAAPRRVGGC